MPTALAVNDRLEVKFYFTTGNQVGINVVNYTVESLTGTVTDKDVAIQMVERVSDQAVELVGPTVNFHGVSCRKWSPSLALAPEISDQVPAVGVRAAGMAPKQLSLVVTKRTEAGGRRGRGRMYIPFPPLEAIQDDGTPTTAYFNLCASYASLVLTPAGIGLMVDGGSIGLSAFVGRLEDYTPLRAITDYRVNDKFGTQRRRGDYGKANPVPW